MNDTIALIVGAAISVAISLGFFLLQRRDTRRERENQDLLEWLTKGEDLLRKRF